MSPFGPLQALRTQPIPDQAAARARHADFRRVIRIDAAAPQYGEALVDIRTLGVAGENYYYSEKNPPYWGRAAGAVPQLWLRQSVAEKLVRVNGWLAPQGLELFVFDGWRPRAVQAYFHDVWMPAEQTRRDPGLKGDALVRAVEKYWAAPSRQDGSPAPHATGGAVDLTLRWTGGEALWMGSIFDDVTALAHRDRFEAPQGFSFSDDEARANRRLLHWLMDGEGFAGHPGEWWHFSFGDQLWAALSGAPAAHYGLAAPISE
jgi:D-alanyl-D-alanine dipeptidase